MSEFDDQCAVFTWSEYNKKRLPELYLLEGSLNGVKLPIGLAVKAKKAGMKAGKPDIELPVSRGGFRSLYIEMKFGRNKPTDNQIEYMSRLGDEGALCVVCIGAKAAIDTICSYLEREESVAQGKFGSKVAAAAGGGNSYVRVSQNAKKAWLWLWGNKRFGSGLNVG